MKIAVVSNTAGSLLNFRGPLLVEMVRRGHQVLAFAPDHDETTRAALAALGVLAIDYRLARTGTDPVQDLGTLVDLRRRFKSHRPDLVFSSFMKPVVYGTLAAWLAGVPRRFAMIEGLGFAFTDSGKPTLRLTLVRPVLSILLRTALAKAQGVIVLNADDRAELLDQSLVRSENCEILGGIGVDLNDWPYSPPPVQPVTFILLARLLWDKGVGDYAEAARLVKQTHPQARFILLGGLDENPAAVPRSAVDAWVNEGVIDQWPGHAPARPWLERASIFVLPSYYREGVPRSTQEAMALGRPVITTDLPGCRETIVDGVNGFMVPPRDAEALATAMRRFIDEPEIILPMGRESRRLAEERFNVHKQNRKLLGWMGLEQSGDHA